MSGWLEALLGKVLSSGVSIPLSGLNFTGGIAATPNPSTKVTDVSIAEGVVAPSHLQAQTLAGVGVPFTIAVTFEALTPGTNDAVTVVDSDQPEIKILDSWYEVTTAIGGSTLRLCSTASGGTDEYGGSISSASSGVIRNAGSRDTDTVPASSPVFLRRSDRGVAGTVYLLCVIK